MVYDNDYEKSFSTTCQKEGDEKKWLFNEEGKCRATVTWVMFALQLAEAIFIKLLPSSLGLGGSFNFEAINGHPMTSSQNT